MHEGIIAITGFFTSVILFIYLFFKTRNQERMEMIRNNVSADLFSQRNQHHSNLKWGILLVSLGIGVLVGAILEQSDVLEDAFGFFFSLLLFGGLGLILFYFLMRNKIEH